MEGKDNQQWFNKDEGDSRKKQGGNRRPQNQNRKVRMQARTVLPDAVITAIRARHRVPSAARKLLP